MKRYFINEVKVGETAGGIACGPVGGNIVATVKYTSSGKTEWLNLVEVDGGFSCFYQTEKDCFDDLVKEDFEDKVFSKYMEDSEIGDFDDVELGGEYPEVFEGLAEARDNPAARMIRYIIALVRCGWDEVEALKGLAVGKYLDEVEIPVSDLEKEWLADQEEEFETEA